MAGRGTYLDFLIDDLWLHARSKPCHRPLDATVLELIEWVNSHAVTEEGKGDLFRFYIDDLRKNRRAG